MHLEEAAEMFGVAILLAALAEYREVLDARAGAVNGSAPRGVTGNRSAPVERR